MNVNNDKKYYLMHKDRKVMYFDFAGNVSVINKKFMPYGLYIEENNTVDSKTNNLLNIYNWLARRVITIDRKYSKEIYNYLKIAPNSDDRTKSLFSISYHSLSLTDVYWVKDINEKIYFADINLYDNSLSNSFVDIFLRGKGFTIKHYPIPIHLQKCYNDLGYKQGDLKIAEEISNTELSIPLYYGMSDNDINKIVDLLNSFKV